MLRQQMSTGIMLTNGAFRFGAVELQNFNWIYGLAPCFPINSSKISIITNPSQFYLTLCDRFQNAKRRISFASLYIGTGELEKRLLKVTKENLLKNENVTFSVLLDYQRGTRGAVNSWSLLREFVNEVSGRSCVSFYQTPRLLGSWSRALPARYNELVGLQHMKLYIADDKVILSGANCSNDYFEQRQDRYIEIEDRDLANFYSELIDEVSSFSKKCTSNGINSESEISKDLITKEANKKITCFIEKWKEHQLSKLNRQDASHDTWIFPLMQMGDFNITQDEEATQKILGSAPKSSYLRIATGYFNLTEQYSKTLLHGCKANISLLMAHPNANGFLGASGPAGGIPDAYSLIAKKFLETVQSTNQSSRIQMFEYERPQWTFHAKGLWYYPQGKGVPWATVVGSANLGERSVKRDLEAQAAILTVSPDLQSRLHDEYSRLHKCSTECSHQLEERPTPLWVRAAVGLFRTYF